MTEQKTIRRLVAEQVFGANKAPVDDVLQADFMPLSTEVDAMVGRAKALPKTIKDDTDLEVIGKFIVDAKKLCAKIEETRKDESGPLHKAKTAVDGFFKGLDGRVADVVGDGQRVADDYSRRKAAEEKARLARLAEEARKKAAAEEEKAEKAKTVDGAARAEGRADALNAHAENLERQATGAPGAMVKTRMGGVTASAKASWAFRIDDYSKLQETLGPLGPFLSRDAVEAAIRAVVRIQKNNTSLPGVTVYQDTKATFRGR